RRQAEPRLELHHVLGHDHTPPCQVGSAWNGRVSWDATGGESGVVLMCTAVNFIDASAVDRLQAINERLRGDGVRLHLSEVKGPVLDRLRRAHDPGRVADRVFLSHYQALATLDPDSTERAISTRPHVLSTPEPADDPHPQSRA
ncbi:MAG: STAS domain-containing protein, partial [Pseudomonadota bacterium]